MTKLQLLEQDQVAVKPDLAAKLEARRQDAQERLAEARGHVAELEGETAQLKTAWDDRRNQSRNTASRGPGLMPPPPPAPMPLPPPRNHWRTAPRGDVNDTPSAPDTEAVAAAAEQHRAPSVSRAPPRAFFAPQRRAAVLTLVSCPPVAPS